MTKEPRLGQSEYDEVKANGLPDGVSTSRALEILAGFVNCADDQRDGTALRKAIQELKRLLNTPLSPLHATHCNYFLANAWSSIKHSCQAPCHNWEDEALGQEILALRRARTLSCSADQVPMREILTNLGNALSHIGRSPEAIEYYNEVLQLDPEFAMASGNKGYALFYYANALYDPQQRNLMCRLAYPLLNDAAHAHVHEGARTTFERYATQIASSLRPDCLECENDLDSLPLGNGDEEKSYRQWCLSERLFLNPLNDATKHTIAAKDALMCPSMVTSIDEGPCYYGLYNQLKQEFVSARYILYQGLVTRAPHFSDRDVRLYNTFDYPAYGLGVEQVKLAFLGAYSLFDKIAYFLNDYLKLGIPEWDVYFRKIWYRGRKRQKGLLDEFTARPNWMMQGLFWISKDLYCDDDEWKEVLDPDAQELRNIRNHVEHKYLKLHGNMWNGSEGKESELIDRLSHSIYLEDFQHKTLRLFKTARAALIYLALAVHQEERRKANARDPNMKSGPVVTLETWNDAWKT